VPHGLELDLATFAIGDGDRLWTAEQAVIPPGIRDERRVEAEDRCEMLPERVDAVLPAPFQF